MTDQRNPAERHPTCVEVLRLFQERGNSQYGREAVTQLEHALQVALLAEQAGASATLITSGLLHDVGHLLHKLPEDAPERGVDDHHEVLAARWLQRHFGPQVAEPARLHVAAKRYLCTVEPAYLRQLSPPSVLSLELQGGVMTETEVGAFQAEPYFEEAVRVRRWDDTAKIPQLPTPPIEHYATYIEQALADCAT